MGSICGGFGQARRKSGTQGGTAGWLLSPTQSLCVLSAAQSEAELVFGGRRGPAGAAAGLKSVQLQRLSSGEPVWSVIKAACRT